MLTCTHTLKDFRMTHTCWKRRLALGIAVLLVSCGQPIQINNRTPQPSGTPLIAATDSTVLAESPEGAAPEAPTLPATEVTASPEATALPAAVAVTPVEVVVVTPRLVATPTGDERWAAFTSNRSAFESPMRMSTLAPSPLLWLDPRNGQVLEIGLLNGDFVATATMNLTSDNSKAYEVEYRINQDYGLTSISEAVAMRMRDAGYAASVRAFVVATDNIIEIR